MVDAENADQDLEVPLLLRSVDDRRRRVAPVTNGASQVLKVQPCVAKALEQIQRIRATRDRKLPLPDPAVVAVCRMDAAEIQVSELSANQEHPKGERLPGHAKRKR